MISEHDRVQLAIELPEYGLLPGDVGTVVSPPTADGVCVVSFMDAAGYELATVPLSASEIAVIPAHAVLHVRLPKAA